MGKFIYSLSIETSLYTSNKILLPWTNQQQITPTSSQWRSLIPGLQMVISTGRFTLNLSILFLTPSAILLGAGWSLKVLDILYAALHIDCRSSVIVSGVSCWKGPEYNLIMNIFFVFNLVLIRLLEILLTKSTLIRKLVVH